MLTAVGHWIVFLFPSVSLYFPNFSVKSLGRLPERPLVCLVKVWFTILEWALGTTWLDYSTATLPFTGRQISEMKSVPRRIFGGRRENVIIDGMCDLYATSNVIRWMKSGVMQAAGRYRNEWKYVNFIWNDTLLGRRVDSSARLRS